MLAYYEINMNRLLKYSHLLATLGSVGLLIGAFGFQEILGFKPCTLCIWQRWPHAIIPLIFIVIVLIPNPIWFILGFITMVISFLLAGFHVGVEQDWWEGLASCSSSETGLSPDTILDFSEEISVVLCDEIVWSFMGLSMAGWNAVFSLLFAFLWLYPAWFYKSKKI